MRTYARINGGIILELISLDESMDVASCFHPDIAKTLVDITDESPLPQVGYSAVQDSNRAWVFAEQPSPQMDQLEQAMQTLRSLDAVLPRIAEDIIEAAGIDETNLPQIVRDRLAAKRAARAIVTTQNQED